MAKEEERISGVELARLQLDALPVALFVIDARDAAILDANQVACERLGYSRTELLRMRVPEVEAELPLGTEQAWREHVETIRRAGRLTVEGQHRRKDGTVFPVIVSLVFATLSDGRKVVLASVLDISAERKLQAELADVESRARAIVSAMPDLVFLLSRDGTYLDALVHSEELLAFPRSAFLGKRLEEVVPPEVARLTRESLARVFERGGIEVFEYELPLGGLPRRWEARLVKRSEHDAVAVCRDVTELRFAQRRLVENSRLTALGEMSASVAHEIRNPLAAILLSASALESSLERGEVPARERVQRIGKAARRMAEIVDALRTLSRGDQQDPLVSVAASDLVRDALSLCREAFLTRQVELIVQVPPSVRLDCRPGQLVQILLNLLTNSLDAVQDLPTRWCKLVVEEKEGRVLFSVIDSGPGIAPHLREHLMRPFFTTKTVGKGTGLGLSISQRLAERHRGTLLFDESSPNTCFRLCVPASAAAHGCA